MPTVTSREVGWSKSLAGILSIRNMPKECYSRIPTLFIFGVFFHPAISRERKLTMPPNVTPLGYFFIHKDSPTELAKTAS